MRWPAERVWQRESRVGVCGRVVKVAFLFSMHMKKGDSVPCCLRPHTENKVKGVFVYDLAAIFNLEFCEPRCGAASTFFPTSSNEGKKAGEYRPNTPPPIACRVLKS